MSESTVTKSNVFKEDLSLATGGTGAAETGTRKTSTGGDVALTKLDASHLKFRTVEKSIDDLVDGGKDVTIKPLNIDAGGTLIIAGATTLTSLSSAGFVKNSAAGLLSGGNALATADIPSGLDAALIGNGSVSTTEFQYLSGVTSDIQTQINSATSPATQAQQETGTATANYVAPATQQYHPTAAKAWVFVTGAGTPAIAASYNVTSVTDNDVGKFTINFTKAFSSINYSMAGMCDWKSGVYGTPAVCLLASTPPAAASCHVETPNAGAAADIDYWSVIFYGDQA